MVSLRLLKKKNYFRKKSSVKSTNCLKGKIIVCNKMYYNTETAEEDFNHKL